MLFLPEIRHTKCYLSGRCRESFSLVNTPKKLSYGVQRPATLISEWCIEEGTPERNVAIPTNGKRPESNLKEQEDEQGFLTWSREFLEEDPVGMLEQGGSIAEAVSNNINKRLNATMANRTSTPEGKSRLARRNRARLQARYKIQYREYWHGAVVNIAKNGTLRIFVSTDQPALSLSLGKRVYQKVQAYGGPTTIEFAKTGIALKVGEHIFQARSGQMLSRLKGGTAWIKQLDREVEHLERQTFASSDDTSQSMTPDNRDSAVTQQQAGVSEAVISGDLRHRLLSNALFHYSKWPHGLKAGRVYFRGVAIYVPKPAEVCKGVRILCDLSAENVSHSTPCAIDATEEDPARRLGIRVTFFNKDINAFDSQWYQQEGEQNIRKLNSLVDFLLDKDIAYTQSQSRRYLGKQKKADKNLEVQYTS